MKYLFTLIVLLILRLSQAQDINGFLASGGSSVSLPSVRVHHVLGSTFIGTSSAKSTYISQGLLFPAGLIPTVPTFNLQFSKIDCYPNPANGYFKISFAQEHDISGIEIRSVQSAQLIYKASVENNKILEVITNNWISGTYMIQSIHSKGNKHFQGFIIVINQ